jgi:DNA-binding transcriptional ArsR family regulator
MEIFIYSFIFEGHMPDERLARALGSRVRRDMIHALIKEDLSVHEIADRFNISEANSSKHLKKLFDLGILNTYLEGRFRYYSMRIKELTNLIKWFDIVASKLGGAK